MIFEKKIRKAAADKISNIIYTEEKESTVETMTNDQIINKLETDIKKMKRREKVACVILASAAVARLFYKKGYDKCLSDIEKVSSIEF